MELRLPPFWRAKSSADTHAGGKPALRYTIEAPRESSVREADMTVILKNAAGKVIGELSHRPEVTGAVTVRLSPVPVSANQPPALLLHVRNNSPASQRLSWDVTLDGEQELKNGEFTPVGPTSAYFTDSAAGSLELEGDSARDIILPVSGADLYKVYRAKVTVRDASGRVTRQERPVSAFYGVPKARAPLAIDGLLDEAAWRDAPVRRLDKKDQFYAFVVKDRPVQDWNGEEDLSADIRYLWDDDHFYVSVDVKDDVAGKILHADGSLWQQDGLQFLIDPVRTSDRKVGKYEYSVGEGTKGPQAWCTLSADGAAPAGNVPEIKVAIRRGQPGRGDVTYEIAFPWKRLAPFKPGPGNNLGLTLIVNEDDGAGRDAFMTWFGNAHSKDIDTVGDLILLD